MPRRSFPLLLAVAAALTAVASARAADPWLIWFSPALREVLQRQTTAQRELASLGTPVVGQTVPEFGYQHPRLAAPPPTSPWVQIDLESAQPIDGVALVPAQLDWQSVNHAAYGFPRRFRVDLSDDPAFATFTPVAVLTDTDFPDPGLAPVTLPAGGRRARYVRVTVTKLAVENDQYFFALAELMVISGRRNLAIGRPVRASAAVNLPPRWSPANLVDGRTPLGPPVERELLPYDGLYAGDGPVTTTPPLWMQVDLGRPFPLDEVRIHPVHARIGADIPGFAFPSRFRVEASVDAAFTRPLALLDASAADFPNPGNNPVTIRAAEPVTARYVRFTMVAPSRSFNRNRFGLSEIEVFSGDTNVARQGTASAPPDPSAFSAAWPVAQLIDGYTSYGRLIELPAWLAAWQRRTALRTELDALAESERTLTATARRRAAWTGGGLGLVALAAGGILLARQRRHRERELERFRTRLAHDLHDEIGSNLAGLAMLSETAADASAPASAPREDWLEVNRVARETTDAMREVLWLVGARQEMGIDLAAHLRLAAARMLPGRTVHWTGDSEPLPTTWSADTRRHIFLFFKEALANIARHSSAKTVELSLHPATDGFFKLIIADDGCGFDPATVNRGVGLNSLRERARAIGGTCVIETSPARGTRITLRIAA